MGLAASQGKLLFMTARLSNNEFEQQNIAYAKQRLADNTEQINDDYLAALQKTKYQVLTGYNGTDACYQDISFYQLTGMNAVANGKQYLIKSNKGKVLVSDEMADAFKAGNGDFNTFLKKFGLTQAHVDFKDYDTATEEVHNAWDKYLVSVGKSIDDIDSRHITGFGYNGSVSARIAIDEKDENGNKIELNTGFGTPTYQCATATYTINGVKKDLDIYQETKEIDDHGYDTTNYYTLNSQLIAALKDDVNGTPTYGVFFFKPDSDEPTEVENVTYDPVDNKYKCDGEAYDTLYAGYNYETNEIVVSTDIKNKIDILRHTDSFGNSVDVHTDEIPLMYEGSTQNQRELYDYAVALTAAYVDKYSQTNIITTYDSNGQPSGTTYLDLKYDAQQLTYYRNIFNEMSKCGFTTAKELNFEDINLK